MNIPQRKLAATLIIKFRMSTSGLLKAFIRSRGMGLGHSPRSATSRKWRVRMSLEVGSGKQNLEQKEAGKEKL